MYYAVPNDWTQKIYCIPWNSYNIRNDNKNNCYSRRNRVEGTITRQKNLNALQKELKSCHPVESVEKKKKNKLKDCKKSSVVSTEAVTNKIRWLACFAFLSEIRTRRCQNGDWSHIHIRALVLHFSATVIRIMDRRLLRRFHLFHSCYSLSQPL